MSPKRPGLRRLLSKLEISGRKGNKESEARGQEGSSSKGPEPETSISSAFKLVARGHYPIDGINIRPVRQLGPKFLEFILINELVWQLIGLVSLAQSKCVERYGPTC